MKLLIILVLILAIPVIELYLLISAGSTFGTTPTILTVVISAIVGAYVLKVQGLANLDKMEITLQQGGIPTGALFEMIFILIGGVLLIIPGFLTDIIGILVFIWNRWICKIPCDIFYLNCCNFYSNNRMNN